MPGPENGADLYKAEQTGETMGYGTDYVGALTPPSMAGQVVQRSMAAGGDAFAEATTPRAPTINEKLGPTKITPLYARINTAEATATMSNARVVRPAVRRTDNFYDQQWNVV